MNVLLSNQRSFPTTARFLLLALLLAATSKTSANHCDPGEFPSTFTYSIDTYTAIAATPWMQITPVWWRDVTYTRSRLVITTHACFATEGDRRRLRNLINPIDVVAGPFVPGPVVIKEFRYFCLFAPGTILPPSFDRRIPSLIPQSDTLPSSMANAMEGISDSIGYPGQRLSTNQPLTFSDIVADYGIGFSGGTIPMNNLNQISANFLPPDRLDTIFFQFETALQSIAADLGNGNPQNPVAYQSLSQILTELASYPDLVQEPIYTSALPHIQDAALAMANMASLVNSGFPSNNEQRDFLEEIERFRLDLIQFSRVVHQNLRNAGMVNAVPGLSEWGLVILGLLLLCIGGMVIFRRGRSLEYKKAN